VCGLRWGAARALRLGAGRPEEPDPDRQGERTEAGGDGGAPVRDRYPEAQGGHCRVLDAPDRGSGGVRAGFSRHDPKIEAEP
jgi:hypothetical protein